MGFIQARLLGYKNYSQGTRLSGCDKVEIWSLPIASLSSEGILFSVSVGPVSHPEAALPVLWIGSWDSAGCAVLTLGGIHHMPTGVGV